MWFCISLVVNNLKEEVHLVFERLWYNNHLLDKHRKKKTFSKERSHNVFILFDIDYILSKTTRLSLDQVSISLVSLLLTQK